MNLAGPKQTLAVEIRGDSTSLVKALSDTSRSVHKFSTETEQDFSTTQAAVKRSMDDAAKSLTEFAETTGTAQATVRAAMDGATVSLAGFANSGNAALSKALSGARAEIEKFGTDSATSLREAHQAVQQVMSGFGDAGNPALAKALLDARVNIQQFGADASTAVTDTQETVKQAMGESAQAVEGFSDAAEGGLGRLQGVVRRLAGPVGFALLAKQIGQVGIGFHDFSQKAEISLKTMLGSAAAARSFLADVLEFAKETPHSFPDWTEQAQTLVSMGIATQDVIPVLRAVGDAAAGMSKGFDGVERLVDIFATIQTTGTLTGVEITRLSRAGIPALKMLANEANMTAEAFRSEISDGAISAEWAIEHLVKGINEGTVGINGATIAFGGLSQEVKESGGWTATIDSARSAFRNMSAALTESLLPVLTTFIDIGGEAMKFVRGFADGFNMLPVGLKVAVAALLLTRVALTKTAREAVTASAGVKAFQANLAAVRTQAALTGTQLGWTAGRFTALKTTALGAGNAMLGAFGGPIGLAITGAAVGFGLIHKHISDAKDELNEIAGKIDVFDAPSVKQGTEDLLALRDAANAAYQDAIAQSDDWLRLGPWSNVNEHVQALKLTHANEALTEVNEKLANTAINVRKVMDATGAAGDKIKEVAAQEGIDLSMAVNSEEAAQNVERLSEAVIQSGIDASIAAQGWAYYSDEQKKAVDGAGKSAEQAFDAAFNIVKRFKETVITDDDIAKATDNVTQATRRLRDAEYTRNKESKKDKDSNQKIREEEAVADARKALADATKELSDLEKARKPVSEQMAEHYKQSLTDARKFAGDIRKVAEEGLDAGLVQQLIQAGPEAAAPQLEAMLSKHGAVLIELANDTYAEMDALNQHVVETARLTQMAIESPTSDMSEQLPLAMRIAAERETGLTVEAIAEKLGEHTSTIRDVGMKFGMTWLTGFREGLGSMEVQLSPHMRVGSGRPPGYAMGGVYPGYTPGRDIGYIGVSGGEAIMRPEFTRAVGHNWVHSMNALARSGGVAAIKRAMGPYLGGFAMGGVPAAPQVITVPVTSRHESHAPVHVGAVYVNDGADFFRALDQRRANNSLVGRRP